MELERVREKTTNTEKDPEGKGGERELKMNLVLWLVCPLPNHCLRSPSFGRGEG